MQDPFRVLEHEHRLIDRVLAAVASAVERGLPLDYFRRAVEFFDVYAGEFHHAKEEDILYRFLVERGMPRDYGPLGVILEEHDYGAAHIAAMRDCLRAEDLSGLRAEMGKYLELLSGHVRAEDDILLPMGRAMLTADEIAEVAEAFETVPDPSPSVQFWVDLAERLVEEAEVPA